MEKILFLCKKENVPLFKGQEGFETKTFDEFSSILLKLFSYDFMLVADLEQRKFPHMEYNETDSVLNYLAINGLSRYGSYTTKELQKGISVVEHSIALLNAQKINLQITV